MNTNHDRTELDHYKYIALRSVADLDNYRKRVDSERKQAEAVFKPVEDNINRPTIQCPFCSGTYNHVERVGTELDPSEDEIEVYTGTCLVFERRGGGERRSAVRIDFRGECGHYWSLILQQHKGVMEVFARRMETPPIPVAEWEANPLRGKNL